MSRRKKNAADNAAAPQGKEGARGAKAKATARRLARTRIEVAAHQLRPAPWNPRPEITSESVADITASIREIGLIQPLVVIKDPDKPSHKGVDFYLVVAGHRRFKACVDAGLSPIPCDEIECDVETAKRVTMIENLQRRDVDPLMESDLIAGLIEGGMTQAEIAAETGRGERWVARRANLRNLSESWRKRIAKGEKFTVDCLEHVAAYPQEIQESLKDAEGYYYGGDREVTTWQQISSQFESASRDLKSAAFDTAECLGCTNNTGCCPDLFDLDGGKNAKLGRCLCNRCWYDKCEAYIADTLAKAEKKGIEVVRKKPDSPWAATDRKTKEYTTLYVYKDGDQTVAKWFSPPEKPTEKEKEEQKALKAAQKEARRKELLVNHVRDVVRDAIGDRIKDGGLMENDFVKLAKVRLQRDLRHNCWDFKDDFVDDYVSVFGLDGVELDEEAASEYLKTLKDKEASKGDPDDADDDDILAEANELADGRL